MASRVVVTLPLPESVLSGLRDRADLLVWGESSTMPLDVLHEWSSGAQGVLCGLGTPFSAATISHCRELRVISSISVGVDHIDLKAATAAGIAVGHTPGVLVDSTADMALALMLAATRRLVEADRFVRAGQWSNSWDTGFFLGTDLSRATVGLVGLGPIGQAVARRLQGFGARVIAWNRTPRSVAGVALVTLEEVFSTSDVVSLHTALTPDTQGLVSRARLQSMKDGALLVNTARGGLVDEAALADELSSGRLRAGLDVYAEEPVPEDSPLLQTENAVLVPHLGSATAATRGAMVRRALDNLIRGLAVQPVPHCANPTVYDDH